MTVNASEYLQGGHTSMMNLNADVADGNVETESLVSLTASIVSANVATNAVGTHDLCDMIVSVHSALSSLRTAGESATKKMEAQREPAVPIEDSIEPEFIICLEDGKKLKTLKRHLRAKYQMTPEEYRAKWNLPPDYPMAAPSYLDQRRKMAHKIGLGLRPKARKVVAEDTVPAPTTKVVEKPTRRRKTS